MSLMLFMGRALILKLPSAQSALDYPASKGTQTSQTIQVSRLTTSHVYVKPWNAWLLMRRVMVGALGCIYWERIRVEHVRSNDRS